jgi:uncharacterized Rmd1/YagE family protein
LQPHYHTDLLLDEVLHVHLPKETSVDVVEDADVFFFENGSIVGWGAPEGTVQTLVRLAKPAESGAFAEMETEYLDVRTDASARTGMQGDVIVLGRWSTREQRDDATLLAKIAFANGLARSTKLAALETALEGFLARTRSIPHLLATGEPLPDRHTVLKRTGELLIFRSQLNLHSELNETPDLYWAKPELETYYREVSKKLDITPRIVTLNRKLDYANEVVGILKQHLMEMHSLKLEWIIIYLIAVEVVFEIIHWIA